MYDSQRTININLELGRSFEAALNIIFDLGSSLTEVGPGLGIVHEAMLVSPLTGPYDTRRCAGGI